MTDCFEFRNNRFGNGDGLQTYYAEIRLTSEEWENVGEAMKNSEFEEKAYETLIEKLMRDYANSKSEVAE